MDTSARRRIRGLRLALILSRAMNDNTATIAEFVRLHTAVGELDPTALAVDTLEYLDDEMQPDEAEPLVWAAITDAFTAHIIPEFPWTAALDAVSTGNSLH